MVKYLYMLLGVFVVLAVAVYFGSNMKAATYVRDLVIITKTLGSNDEKVDVFSARQLCDALGGRLSNNGECKRPVPAAP